MVVSGGMGSLGMIVYCECATRGELPPHRWGQEPEGTYFLSEEQRTLWRTWDQGAREVDCPHRYEASFVVRGREAYAALDWAIELGEKTSRQECPVLTRLRYPSGDFGGDLIVIPPADAALLAVELQAHLDPVRIVTDPLAEVSPPAAWKAAIAATVQTGQPICIGYGL